MRSPKANLILILLLLQPFIVSATTILGRVSNKNNEPLPFANVYIKGSTKGTTTNINGFYKLDVPQGKVELVFRFLGYKMKVETVMAASDEVVLDVVLEPENYTLSEVKILADAEDPAYAIIRKAISKRKFYLNEVDEFSCDVYIKGLQRITKYPAKLFGVEVNLSEIVDTATGIVYLSESVSKYNFKKPDNVKEVMISSKVSGKNKAFSFNQASDMDFNFYENNIMVEGLSKRGFISPIASNAMMYYRFRLDGSFLENGKWINRIEVIPRRKNDPVFAGYIYIQDNNWRIHNTDLYLTRDSQIEFVDTLRVNQTFIPVDESNDVWMKGSVAFYFVFSAFGFEGNGNYVGVFSGYEVNPSFEKKTFKGSVMTISESANKKDSSYWETIRPVPLTPEEAMDYHKRDSVEVIKESKPYLDSLDKASNKFKFGNILTGYTHENRYRKTQYSINSLLDAVQFNTVEGLNIGLGFGFEKKYENLKSYNTDLNIRYGFSNERASGNAAFRYNYNIKKFAFVRLEVGSDLVQFNEAKPITPLINTSYTLFAEENYMKLYEKNYGRLTYRIEPVNGIRITAQVEYANRKEVFNTTDYTWVDKETKSYTPNLPEGTTSFADNSAFKAGISTRIRFKQKYVDRPDMYYILGSKYPSLVFNYVKGFNKVFGSDINYDRFEIGLEDRIRLGMLGTLNYYGVYGKFINSKQLYFMDYVHFNGNQTIFSGFESKRFDLLDYYKYSTTDEYIQVFAEHEFGGFILNKIPLIRKLKLNEIAGFRFLHIPGVIDHYETSFGLEKLGIVRADFVMSFNDKGKTTTGFVIGVKTAIGQ